jgi:ABC-type polysaccharide/polyol phosphate transport system ATPase subunit
VPAQQTPLRQESATRAGNQDEPIIEIRRLCKRFCISRTKQTSLVGFLTDLLDFRTKRRFVELDALSGIDLEVKRGECLGLIGKNGSGKSTLLRLMGGIMEPDSGELQVRGTTGTLIELGAGFHDDLTGRENTYINASALGFTRREIDGMMSSIVDFSGMGRFMDTPVRMYSMGMFMRLGFAIAMNIKPAILLIDEILAVGDDEFQRKCIHKIEDLHRSGTTIVVVSHNLPMIERICDRVVLLYNGRIVNCGRPREMISEYKRIQLEGRDVKLRDETASASERPEDDPPGPTVRWGTGEATIRGVTFRDQNGNDVRWCRTGDPLTICIDYAASCRISNPMFGVGIHGDDGLLLAGPDTRFSGFAVPEIEGEGTMEYVIDSIPFLSGSYYISAFIYEKSGIHPFDHWDRFWKLDILESDRDRERAGVVSLPSHWVIRVGGPDSGSAALPGTASGR